MHSFDEIYNDLKNKNYYDLEDLRKKKLKLFVVSLISLAGIIIMLFLFVFNMISWNTDIFFVLFLFSIFLFLFSFVFLLQMSTSKLTNYFQKYKEYIIAPLITYFFPVNIYIPDKHIDESIYYKCSFKENFNSLGGDDKIITSITKDDVEIPLIFSEIHSDEKTIDDNGNENYARIFSGVAGFLDYDINCDCNIEIRGDNVTFFKQKNNVPMDSSEFEKYFDVNCDNRIVAMQIFTADIMNKLVDLKVNSNILFEINIVSMDKIYFRLFTYPLFEPYALKNTLDKKTFKKYFDILKCINDLSHILYDIIKNINEEEI